jgi:predicted nucleic acid-binding protein
MSGNRYLLDTNAIVTLLQGNSQLVQLLQSANWVGISGSIAQTMLSGQNHEEKPARQGFAVVSS